MAYNEGQLHCTANASVRTATIGTLQILYISPMRMLFKAVLHDAINILHATLSPHSYIAS